MNPQKTIKVIVVDDHSIIRESLVRMINLVENMQVMASCKDGEEAFEAVKVYQPDIVLMDAIMPNLNGVEATKLIRQMYPKVGVLMLTTFSDKALIINAFKAGIDGYVLKDITSDRLIQSIYDVVAGEFIIPTEIARKLVMEVVEGNIQEPTALSRTEEEIAHLLKQGQTNKEIAEALHISYGTTRNYVSDIYKKLGETDREKVIEKLNHP